MQRIPLDVLEDIKQMFDEGQPISFIRARIRNRIPLHIKTDARWFMNLRVTIERHKLEHARVADSDQACGTPQQPGPSCQVFPKNTFLFCYHQYYFYDHYIIYFI